MTLTKCETGILEIESRVSTSRSLRRRLRRGHMSSSLLETGLSRSKLRRKTLWLGSCMGKMKEKKR